MASGNVWTDEDCAWIELWKFSLSLVQEGCNQATLSWRKDLQIDPQKNDWAQSWGIESIKVQKDYRAVLKSRKVLQKLRGYVNRPKKKIQFEEAPTGQIRPIFASK